MPLTPKCVKYFERRPYPPGEHGRKRKNTSDYKTRLMEKQRLRAQYDVSETQLRLAFDRAKKTSRNTGAKTGEALLLDLEARLDATVLRAGFARTIYQARQTVTHHHVTVNGRRVDRPSYRVEPGDVVAIAERSKPKQPFQVAASGAHAEAPKYLDVRLTELTCFVVRRPQRTEIPVQCEEQLVVEHYSR
ncbi:30S ribosomal protein S4 [Geodermatophilus sp. Leaf369]|nr:30S ribosomal protein S4 [Geodermatophilus sp. Leaf369]